MSVSVSLLLLLTAQAADTDILVTASRAPVEKSEAGVSATVIEREEIEALALPAASDLLRLVPGVSVAATGPRGTQTQVRIRGAEANHSLLFVDGIRFNDPAAGNEARFELLANDALSRIEIVRGPQSALWGSEALGGVIAVQTAVPAGKTALGALGEYGSLDSGRASAQFTAQTGAVGIGGALGWLRSEGIDSFGQDGERDGFENRSASLKAVFSPLPATELGLVGHWVEGTSDYDGFDPATFRRADTLDSTDNRIRAVRAWASIVARGWSIEVGSSFLDSANRNMLADAPLNRTSGERFAVGGEVSRAMGGHRLTAAAEHENEEFRARDQAFLGGTDQDRSRQLTALVGQWRAEWSKAFTTDVAVRHDRFSAFADTTTLRAIASFKPARAWTVHAGYGEGVAQPSFYDLFGFFPGSFAGNAGLRPESSKGWEAGGKWSGPRSAIGFTVFSNRLQDEIVDVFDPATFQSSTDNVDGKSRRRGLELDAEHHWAGMAVRANYTFLDAGERRVAGTAAVREIRRPRHSANLVVTGKLGAFDLGASLAYVGKRRDSDFDAFPAPTVTLGDYALGSLTLAYPISPAIEAYARVENALGADYQDVVGFNTPGRMVHAGLRLRFGD